MNRLKIYGTVTSILYSEIRNPNPNRVCFKSCVWFNRAFSHDALYLVLNAVKRILSIVIIIYLNKSHWCYTLIKESDQIHCPLILKWLFPYWTYCAYAQRVWLSGGGAGGRRHVYMFLPVLIKSLQQTHGKH